MPKRTDIRKILVLGSGPIVIGQGCEFDYSGTQAIRALKEEGYETLLVNSNPATIMTDPGLAHRVYVEPLTISMVTAVIEKEKPDAILPTMGGQTALNLTMALHRQGVLKKYGVQLLGAQPDVIERAENRSSFRETMASIGVECARSEIAKTLEEARAIAERLGLPMVLRPSFTLGGEGGGILYTREEFDARVERALFLSPTQEVLLEECLTGWKEFELEVVRDKNDNVIIVCSIENLDPMGVHTGDSITVAPAMTLTDREYQHLRDLSGKIIRAIGVETGGSNIQYAIHPTTGRVVCIELNPRVSRSSALASKATGFPIARIAAKLAVGYTLDELTNDITRSTPASFEPSLDYVVVKIPRFDFEKFRPSKSHLSTQMKSVGEVMAVGRTFREALGKALSGLEIERSWFKPGSGEGVPLETPDSKRLWAIADSLRSGVSLDALVESTGVDRWFLERIEEVLQAGDAVAHGNWPPEASTLRTAKAYGWSDRALGSLSERPEADFRRVREEMGLRPAFLEVDTCAGEFEARTPYFYSTYGESADAHPSRIELQRPRVMILGSGPNRIGQGIEFDYCCVHASLCAKELGYDAVMVNCNPETVSTDFDISSRLYFEPLTVEHVLEVARVEKPDGVIVQLGGQTPLKLAKRLEDAGLRVLGTSPESIDWAEDRKKCDAIVKKFKSLGLEQPEATLATTAEEALIEAKRIGFPVVLRPSYVLGGRGMRVIHGESMLRQYIDEAIQVSDRHPVLIDRFLGRATELDVDVLCDGRRAVVCGVMEHIEEAGVHSGDSACSIPVFSLDPTTVEKIRDFARKLALAFEVKGLLNAQFAVQDRRIFLLEVNPRASRTVPFVAKAIGRPIVRYATQIMLGRTLEDLGLAAGEDLDREVSSFSVKAPVFPFDRFPDTDVLLGPEMKSTGEVMGRAGTFARAYAKALMGAGMTIPTRGKAFLSVRDEDKREIVDLARDLLNLDFELFATEGTFKALREADVPATRINKVREGSPHCVEAIHRSEFQLVLNTTLGEQSISDSFSIRRAALERRIPYATILSSGRALVLAIRAVKAGPLTVSPL